MSVPAAQELERFRSAIVAQIGLQFEDARRAFLEEVLQRRVARLSCSRASYLNRLERTAPPAELAALAQELTVTETYFFRHNDQFRALAETVLPERMRARGDLRGLHLLSAGCASGEEAYSLAIVVRETVADRSWDIAIRAVDLNSTALAKAAQGRYSAWALREVPPDVRRKWFCADRRELVLEENLRGAVQFAAANLAGDDPALWRPAFYDVIFCRNVLMYFAPEQMRAAIARIAASLAPGGYLFLGHAETLRGVSDEFQLCHSHDTFYYRRKEDDRPAQEGLLPARIDRPAAPITVSAAAASPTAWIDTIRRASERVTALTSAAASNGVIDFSPTRPSSGGWQLATVFDLLRRERFNEALDYVHGGPTEAEAVPDVLLVKAVLLAQGGQLAAAEAACRRLLLIDRLNAGAHYVLALCCEHAGQRDRAMEADRVAAQLDPAFAMPRLHCGLLARHAGDLRAARSDLAQALALLEGEDRLRLLLFGGGFNRGTLIALCQSAIATCGGRP